jgi:hypothetical protein
MAVACFFCRLLVSLSVACFSLGCLLRSVACFRSVVASLLVKGIVDGSLSLSCLLSRLGGCSGIRKVGFCYKPLPYTCQSSDRDQDSNRKGGERSCSCSCSCKLYLLTLPESWFPVKSVYSSCKMQ